jgi:hypothetical protein
MKTLQPSIAARATAFGLAAVFTLMTVASLNLLASVDTAPGVMAAAQQPRG